MDMKSFKFFAVTFATAILFQVDTASAKLEFRESSFPRDGVVVNQTHAQAQKPWEFERPGNRNRDTKHPIERESNPSYTGKRSGGFRHSVKHEFTLCRDKHFGRGTESCGLYLWVDIKSDQERSGRVSVSCSVQLEMVYEGSRQFTESTWHRLEDTERMYDGKGSALIIKRIYGERMEERLIDAEVVKVNCRISSL
jgi:hypothetical protein